MEDYTGEESDESIASESDFQVNGLVEVDIIEEREPLLLVVTSQSDSKVRAALYILK